MIRRPEVALTVTPRAGATSFNGSGRMSDRAVAFARHFAARAVAEGLVPAVPAAHIHVRRVPRPHIGLGSGTQLAMAVARALANLIDHEDLGVSELADIVGRGKRSAVGAHGSIAGGLIVDGGKTETSQLSPMITRLIFPPSWRIVLIRPHQLHGLCGPRERQAFADLPPISQTLTARMCHLVLLGLLPAVVERDLDRFGEALYELQRLAGECFKSAQGGIYADPSLDQIIRYVRGEGVRGVGQSSWGPTLYAMVEDHSQAQDLATRIQTRFAMDPDELLITQGDNQGSCVTAASDASRPAS